MMSKNYAEVKQIVCGQGRRTLTAFSSSDVVRLSLTKATFVRFPGKNQLNQNHAVKRPSANSFQIPFALQGHK